MSREWFSALYCFPVILNRRATRVVSKNLAFGFLRVILQQCGAPEIGAQKSAPRDLSQPAAGSGRRTKDEQLDYHNQIPR